MSIIDEWADHERLKMAHHLLEGRTSNGRSVVSHCSCGLAFFGQSIAQADNRWRVHSADATGREVTSWTRSQ